MYVPRLKHKYYEQLVPQLQKALGYTSPMQVPRLEKICLNQGVGRAVQTPQRLDDALQQLSLIAGQKAVATRAKHSIANFKLREGMRIGARVTLHGNRMYEFLDRLITIALPRIRDFKGISATAFDQQGNYTLGIKEQIIFPESSIDRVHTIMGLNITLVTSSNDTHVSHQLLQAFGMPFQTPSQAQ